MGICQPWIHIHGHDEAAVRLIAGGNGNPLGSGRDAVGQVDVPPAFALVHVQNQAGVAGRMADRMVHEQKIRPHLGHRDGIAVDQEPHFHLGGMAALTR